MANEKKIEEKEIGFKNQDVIVKYDGINLVTVPVSKFKLAMLASQGVQLRKGRAQVKILPGNNLINAAIWAIIREDVKHHLASGKLLEINVKGEIKTEKVKYNPKAKEALQSKVIGMRITDISEMTSNEAIRVVKEMNNLESLKSLENKEDRDPVLKHINKQIEKILKKTSQKDS